MAEWAASTIVRAQHRKHCCFLAHADPGNLESDLQAGAKTGYTILWVLLWSTVMVSACKAVPCAVPRK